MPKTRNAMPCLVTVLASLLFFPCFASAAPKKPVKADKPIEVIAKLIDKGIFYLGGRPPKLLDASVLQEIEKDGRIYYRLKLLIQRSSGDTNGSLILFRAKNYGDAFAKLFNVDPANKRRFDLFFPKSIDKTKFPPVKMVFTYNLVTRNSEDNRLVASNGTRRPKGKFRFIESLSQGLPPGQHQLRIESAVDVGDHPIKDMFDIIEWIEFLSDPVGAAVSSIADATEYFSLVGIGKLIISQALAIQAKQTLPQFQLEVLAKVPNVKNLQPSVAVAELAKRLLKYSSKNTLDCPAASKNKVVKQSPVAGARVKKDSEVALTVCRQDDTPPQPTPTVGGPTAKYAAWIRPDRLTCCTTPEGILTYAYQGGLDYTMPANATLLKGGFATEAELKQWVCARSVFYHFWATNYGIVEGYTVSQLPCAINS